MSNPILLRIDVDDKGNPVLAKLGGNVKRTEKKVSEFGRTIKKVFAFFGVYGSVIMLRNALREVVGEAIKFQTSLVKIKAITGAPADAIGRISDEARRLSKETEFSATQISEAMLQMTRMGLSGAQALEALPVVLDTATASSEDLAAITKGLINTMKGFGKAPEDLEAMSDVLAVALNKSSLNLEDFMNAMVYSRSVANSLNVEFNETAAILAVLADAGISGSIAGNTLKNMMLNLLKLTPEVAEALKNTNFEGMQLTEILGALDSAGVPVVDVLDQFNKRGVVGALVVGGLSDKVLELAKDMLQPEITVRDMAKAMREDLAPQAEILKNIMNDLGVAFLQSLGSSSTDAMVLLNEELREIGRFFSENEQYVDSFAAAVKAAGWVVMFLTKGVVDLGMALVDSLKPVFDLIDILSGNRWTRISENIDKGLASAQANIASKARLEALQDLVEARRMEEAILKGGGVASDPSLFFTTLGAAPQTPEAAKQRTLAAEAAYSELGFDPNRTLESLEAQLKAVTSLRAAADKIKEDYGSVVTTPTGGGGGGGADWEQKDEELIRKYMRYLESRPSIGDFLSIDEYKEQLFISDSDLKGLNSAVEKDLENMRQSKQALIDAEEATDSEIVEIREAAYKWLDDWNEERHYEKLLQLKEEKDYTKQMAEEAAYATLDIFSILNQKRLEKITEAYQAEAQVISQRYELEAAAAGSSEFKKQMASERRVQREIQLQKRLATEQKEAAKREQLLANSRAMLNAYVAASDVLARWPDPLTKWPVAMGMLVAGLGLAADMLAINMREGGVVSGGGNSTSDSVIVKASRGERFLSHSDVNSLGGNNNIQRMIDRSDSFSNSGGTVVVQTVIGSRSWIREELLPSIREEMRR